MQQLLLLDNRRMISRERLKIERLARKREQRDIVTWVEIVNDLRDCFARLLQLRFTAPRGVREDQYRFGTVGLILCELNRKLRIAALYDEVIPAEALYFATSFIHHRNCGLLIAGLFLLRGRRVGCDRLTYRCYTGRRI